MKKTRKYIAYIPVHIVLEEKGNIHDPVKELANGHLFSRWSGSGYSYSKKKCRQSDIRIEETIK